MLFQIIDEAEDFVILNCCPYAYYKGDMGLPWEELLDILGDLDPYEA